MAGRVIRGYWDCPQCGTKGIDGLADVCPGCGAGKDKHVRYYMKSVEEVSEEELNAAGISAEESDGLHREWICAYCGSLNNYADTVCARCGADREEKEQDYGGDTQSAKYERDKTGNLHQTQAAEQDKEKRPDHTYVSAEDIASQEKPVKKPSVLSRILLVAALLAAVILLWPHSYSEAISGFAWQRSVTVEEIQTFSESGWSLPSGARQTGAQRELYGYQDVLDHYETVYQTRTRKVFDHYETSYDYTDNGNGTFSEHAVQTPVYRTEQYQEPVQRPVYRSEPVYQTKYYYDIDRWVEVQTYTTGAEDHEAYWSKDYTLGDRQRDTQRDEYYYTIYSDGARERVPYEKWEQQNVGDGLHIKRCLLGIEYSRVEKGAE